MSQNERFQGIARQNFVSSVFGWDQRFSKLWMINSKSFNFECLMWFKMKGDQKWWIFVNFTQTEHCNHSKLNENYFSRANCMSRLCISWKSLQLQTFKRMISQSEVPFSFRLISVRMFRWNEESTRDVGRNKRKQNLWGYCLYNWAFGLLLHLWEHGLHIDCEWATPVSEIRRGKVQLVAASKRGERTAIPAQCPRQVCQWDLPQDLPGTGSRNKNHKSENWKVKGVHWTQTKCVFQKK